MVSLCRALLVLVVGVALGFAALLRVALSSAPRDAECARPEHATLRDAASAACFYSHTYAEARRRFLDAVRAAGLEHEALPVVADDGLFIDVAVLPGRADELLLHVSGTHGTEGFVGSAVQTAALQHANETLLATAADARPTVLFVHALNPFGMANWRRWNEDGVDLNRNAIFSAAGWRAVLEREPNVAGYMDIDHIINPDEPPSLGVLLRSVPLALWRFATAYVATKRALVAATYTRAGGIFYGGTRLSRSHDALSGYLRAHGYTKRVRKLAIVDVHSGLGPAGRDSLMLRADTPQLRAHAERLLGAAAAHEPAAHSLEFETDTAAGDAAAASSGYDLTVGTVADAQSYASLFDGVERPHLLLTQEFGTVHPLRVIFALVRENCAHRFLPPDDAERRAAARGVYDAFVPVTRDARANTVLRGIAVLRAVMAGVFA